MYAKVKEDSRFPIVTAFGGHIYNRDEWLPVPKGKEDEAKSNPYFDLSTKAPKESKPKAQAEKPKAIKPTKAAQELADKSDVDIADVVSENGKSITVDDVKRVIKQRKDMAEAAEKQAEANRMAKEAAAEKESDE